MQKFREISLSSWAVSADDFGVDLRTLELKIARSENLPVLSEVASSVLKLADDPNASARMLEKIIERDPAIAAKLLKVAASPLYGAREVPGVGRAISLLGMAIVRSLVVTVAYQQLMTGKSSSQLFDKQAYWRHSLATGTAARILAKIKLPMRAEEMYTAGLMHDIGLLALEKFCPSELDHAIKLARSEAMPLSYAEQEILGYDHSTVGRILAQRWGLSCIMRHAITYHHDPSEDEEHKETSELVAAGNAIAYQCGFSNHVDTPTCPLDEGLVEQIGLPIEQYDVIRQVVTSDVERALTTFQIR